MRKKQNKQLSVITVNSVPRYDSYTVMIHDACANTISNVLDQYIVFLDLMVKASSLITHAQILFVKCYLIVQYIAFIGQQFISQQSHIFFQIYNNGGRRMLTDNICLLQQGELNIYYFSRVITFILPMLIKYFTLTCQPGL